MNEKIHKAVELVEKGSIQEGIEYVQSLVDEATDEEKLEIADLYLSWGFLDEAKALIEELLLLYPEEGQLYIYVAEIAIEQDREEDAITYLEKITEDDPAYLQALILMADLYQLQGLDEVAEQKLLKAKKIAPDEPLLNLGLGQFYFDIGEHQKAIYYFEKLINKKDENIDLANVHILLADAYVHTGRFEEAFENYAIGLKEKMDLDALFHYGLLAYQLERFELAIAKWKELIKLDPEYFAVYLYLAKAYEHIGDLKESYQTCLKGLQYNEDYKELLVYAAKMAGKLQKYEEMESYLQKAIDIDPNYNEAIRALSSYYISEEQYEKVIQLLEGKRSEQEYDPQFEWDLAKAKNHMEKEKEALNHYQNAYTFFKDNIDFLEDFGYFLLEMANIEQAKQIFKRILQLDPTNIEIEEELLRLEEW